MNEFEVLPPGLRQTLDKSRVALCLASPDLPDFALGYVNDAFCTLTGYRRDEVVGRNCRFLQGPDTTPDSVAAMRAFVASHDTDEGRFPVVNYRSDGTRFLNVVFMARLRDHAGRTRFILGSQFDLTSSIDRLTQNDDDLGRDLVELKAMERETGLAMMGSARMLSDSIATIARLALAEDDIVYDDDGRT